MQYSVVNKTGLDKIVFRLDAEFYHPEFLALTRKIGSSGRSLGEMGAVLDCSAFYPSITNYYDFKGTGVPFLRVNEIQDGLVTLTQDTAFLPERIIDEYHNYIAVALPGDLVIAKGGNTLGKVGLLTDKYKNYAVSRDLVILKTSNLKEINKYYLWLFLHSPHGQKLLCRTASQTGQPHLTLPAILNLHVPVFINQEIFESIFRKSIEFSGLSHSLYKEAEDNLLKELGLNDWKPIQKLSFVKKFTESVNAERFDAEYFQPKYETVIEVVKNYRGGYSFLEETCKIKDRNFTPKYDETYKYIELANISSNGEINGYMENLGKELPSRARRKVSNGDVVVSSIEGSLQSIALITEDWSNAVCSTGFFVLNSGELNSETLLVFLKTVIGQAQLKRGCKGTILTALGKAEFEKIVLPKVEKKVQVEIQHNIVQMYKAKKQSKVLLEIAKQGVEMAIEKSEEVAMVWLKEELNKIGYFGL